MSVPYSFTPNSTIKSAEVNANFAAVVDGTAIENSTITSPKISLTYSSQLESISNTNTSYADQGTGITIITTVNNSIIWVNFAGYLQLTGTNFSASCYAYATISVDTVVQSAKFQAITGLTTGTSGNFNTWIAPLGFSIPIVIPTAKTVTIKIAAYKTGSGVASYTIAGTLSGFLVAP